MILLILTAFLLAMLISAALSAGYWLPWIAPRVAAKWGLTLQIGEMDLFPLRRAEFQRITLTGPPAADGRRQTAASIRRVTVQYESLKALTQRRVSAVAIEGVDLYEDQLLAWSQSMAAAPDTPAFDWAIIHSLLAQWLPDTVAVNDVTWHRPAGEQYRLAHAKLFKSVSPGEAVHLTLNAVTAPLASMTSLPVDDPVRVTAECRISADGLMLDQFTVDAGPLLRASGISLDPLASPDRIDVRLNTLDWDWELWQDALGLEPMGHMRFKPAGLVVRLALGAAPPSWASDFQNGALLVEVLFPAAPLAWSDVTAGQSVEGEIAANIQIIFDPATGRARSAVLVHADVANLIVPGRRVHDAMLMVIGTVEGSLLWREASWDATIQAGAPLDVVKELKPWHAALAGKSSGRFQLSPLKGQMNYDGSATLTHTGGEALHLPVAFSADWAAGDTLNTSALAASVRTSLDGADLGLEVSALIATSPTVSLRADWQNLNLAQAMQRAELFVPLPDAALAGVTSGAAVARLPAGDLLETSVTLRLDGFAAEWPRGVPLLAEALSFDAALTGRGLPWEASRGARFDVHAADEDHFEVSLNDLTPLRDDLMDWRAAVESRVADVAWLAALTSQMLPFELGGAFEQRGDLRAGLSGEAIVFNYEGSMTISDWVAKPREPEPSWSVEWLATSLDLSASGEISPAVMDVSFRVAPATVEINQLVAPFIDWAFFEAVASARGRARMERALADAGSTRAVLVDLDHFTFELPDMMTVQGAMRSGAEMGSAGLTRPWGEAHYDAEIIDATSLGWQLGVWQGDGDIRVRLAPASATLAGDRAAFEGRFEVTSPHGESPYAWVLWQDLRASGDFRAESNIALTDYDLVTSGRAHVGEIAGGGAVAHNLATRWTADLPRARVTLDSARLYGGYAWATITLDGLPASPNLAAEGELMDIDMDDFTANYQTGNITMTGLMNADWEAAWDFQTPASYRARIQAASDVVSVDKDSVKWLLDQAFGGAVNPLGFLSPARTLDRQYKPGGKQTITHNGRIMIPFTQFEAVSRYQRGQFRNQIDLENKYFKIDFQPNVQAPVVLEFLQIAQYNIGN